MTTSTTTGRPHTPVPRVSSMAAGLIGSEILKISTDIRAMVADGKSICNLTVGDFNPKEFPIPEGLLNGITEALKRGETNYPPSDGMLELRREVMSFFERFLGLRYGLDSVLVTGGSRPGIYATYCALVDPGDRVVYPVPSWNNNHYCHLTGAVGVPVLCSKEDAFLPTAELLAPAIRGARLLALNSPLNPTGTAFTAEQLGAICDVVIEENMRRGANERPLYVMYDQVYWMLTFGETTHVDPVSLRPEMEPYTIFIDGISKAFAATGVRVGWTVAPPDISAKMASILGHIGAWSPRAEQVATAAFLAAHNNVVEFNERFKSELYARLDVLYRSLSELRDAGFPVDTIPPTGAIYVTARFNLIGCQTPDGKTLATNDDIRRYLLHEAGLAIVHFQAFGVTEESGWFRLSVGATSVTGIEEMVPRLRRALEGLKGE